MQHKCEQYWADNIGDSFETPDGKLVITTTSVMPFADFHIRCFNVKSVSFEYVSDLLYTPDIIISK